MPKQSISPDPTVKPRGLSPAVKAGNMVFVSGQLPMDAKGQLVGAGDMRAQAQQCFKNIEAALVAAGATMAQVVKISAFLTRLEDFPSYATVRLEVFPQDPPASSTVVVAALARPGCVVEVEAIAVLV